MGAVAVVLGILAVYWIARLATAPPPPVVITSSGPTITQIESLGLLTVARVHVADVLVAEGHSYRGSWLVKGDALFAVDCRQAELTSRDESKKTATIRLPAPMVLQPRVDHERTRTWSVEKETWVPFKGDPDRLRDQAMLQAQRLVQHAVGLPEMQTLARENAEMLLKQMYRLVGWEVVIEWEEPKERPTSPSPLKNPAEMP